MAANVQDNTWSDYVAMLRRRWRPSFVIASLIALGTIYVAYTLPAIFQSSSAILIEEQGIPTDIVQTTVNSYAEQRLQTIYQRITASDYVLQMIERFDLYPEDRDSASADELIARFQDNTLMSPQNVMSVNSRTGREAVVTFGFEVSFLDADPVRARDVTAELAERFVDYNADLRRETTRRTTEFLDTEAESLEAELAEVAARLADFKERNAGNLPEDQGVNMTTWERLREDLTRVEESIREVQQEKAILESQMIETPRYRPVLSGSGEAVLGGTDRLAEAQQELVRLRGRYSDSHPAIINLKREIASLASSPADKARLAQQLRAELAAKELELSAALESYSENHPNVVQIRSSATSIRSQLTDLGPTSSASAQPNNPAYLQLRTRVNTAEAQINDLFARRDDTRSRITDLEARRISAPQVERQFAKLEQEQDLLLTTYTNLRNLGGEAALGDALESGQSGERLTIVEHARVPARPISPNRLSLSFLGIVLALAAGLGVASLADAMDTRVRGRVDIQHLLETSPIGTIPYVENDKDRFRRIGLNVATAAYAFAAVGLVVGAVVT